MTEIEALQKALALAMAAAWVSALWVGLSLLMFGLMRRQHPQDHPVRSPRHEG